MSKPRKHVIFLGAGASVGSGYPLANELRLLLSSQRHLEQRLVKAGAKWEQQDMVRTFFQRHKEAIDIFRKGGFASVDEFCRLASGFPKFSIHVDSMRILTRCVLGVLNPEDEFEKSEYYAFVQNLFETNLFELRGDISVLSFNYDPYLEYLLFRALMERRTVAGLGPDADLGNAATGGYLHFQDSRWLAADESQPENRFSLLKLHGAICPARVAMQLNHEVLFNAGLHDRITALFDPDMGARVPPLMFPWELIKNDLTFVDSDSFPLTGASSVQFPLFKETWRRAQREVKRADKISFVGLSMHPFLTFGLNYLFSGKSGPVHFVVANPDNVTREKHGIVSIDPITPAGRVRSFLQGTEATWERPEEVSRKRFDTTGAGCCITTLKSFDQFIHEEMR